MTMDTPPFPGARKDPMLLIGMRSIELKEAGYFDLAPSQTVTYSAARPIHAMTLTEGDKLYRVFGGQNKAKAKGGFWAPEAPAKDETEGEWRSTNAVEPVWNAGTHVAELTVKKGCTLQTWFGEIESQPAMNDESEAIPGWWLVGGGPQYFCQSWTEAFGDAVTIKTLGNTPWSTAKEDTPAMPDTEVAIAAQIGDLDTRVEAFAHVATVLRLVDSLRAIASATQDTDEAAHMAAAANTVATSANTLLGNVDKDPQAVDLAIRSNLHLGRFIDIDPAQPNGHAAIGALDAVVRNAAAINHRLG
ncbi:hypothetical protein [Pseudooctadecabacter sp.]|uniref:hypothetical protein n=1 Tax=Pseudooctadecabacter sp. TaxID=1966338 RepID=UPI0025E0F75E|nr:hypothetical protein [Pseudooctadecabacter sp.]